MPIPQQAHDAETLAALKSGKTIFDAELLKALKRLADSSERLVRYYEKVFEEQPVAMVTKKRGSSDA